MKGAREHAKGLCVETETLLYSETSDDRMFVLIIRFIYLFFKFLAFKLSGLKLKTRIKKTIRIINKNIIILNNYYLFMN